MIRVLVTGGSKIKQAGVATIVYAFGSHMQSGEVVYDYLMTSPISDIKYKTEIENSGGRVYQFLPNTKGKIAKLYHLVKWYVDILTSNGYQIVHINCDTAHISAMYLLAAKLCGVKNIIIHAHSTQIDSPSKTRRAILSTAHALARPIARMADYRMGCSVPAAEWMFGKKYIHKHGVKVVHNGIDTEQYLFNETVRERKRAELSLDGKFVIGSVARLSYQKNPEFLLECYAQTKNVIPEAALLMVGDGPSRDNVEKIIKERDLKDVYLLGNRGDVPELLQAMDMFVLPSRFEGLGIVYIEAQAAALPCLGSTEVPEDAVITDLMERLPIDDAATWSNRIIEIYRQGNQRRDMLREIKEREYDIYDVSRSLEEFYMSISHSE